MPRRRAVLPLLLCLAPHAPAIGAGEPASPPAEQAPAAEVEDEILVTAQKREESLQKVPLAVAVLSAEDLEELDLRTSTEIATQVPNLEIKSAFSATNPTIFLRGVGLNDFNANASGAVGLYSDEVYLGASSGQVLQLFDLQRIEVLRGPQGTLFGRNTTGGAIHLVTRKPGGGRGGYLRGTYGRFDQTDLEAAFELPLPGEQNALRLALIRNRRDGHTRNLFNGNDENDVDATAVRLQLRLVPHDGLSIDASLHQGGNRAGSRAYQSRGLIDGADVLGYVESENPFEGSYNRDLREDVDLFGGSVTLHWTRRQFTVTSISAYETSDRLDVDDADASPNRLVEADWTDDASQVSQELRLTSDASGRVSWIAGAYFLQEDLRVDNRFDLLRELRSAGFGFDPSQGILLLRQSYDQETVSSALFGQLTYPVADDLTFRVGLRHTWEDRTIDFRTSFEEPEFTIPLIDLEEEVGFSELSGEVGLDYRMGDDLLVFASLRRGFKSGGFNGGALFSAEEVAAVDPELLNSFEAGLKSTWFGDRLRLNATAFLYDYQDLQVFNFINAGGVPIQFLDNASDARIEGLEIELQARPARRLEVGVGLASLEAIYEDFVLSDGTDLSGNRLVSAPRWSVNGSIAYAFEVAGGAIRAHANFNARDDMFFDATNTPRIGTDGYGLLNARVGFEPRKGRYSIALWGKNLSDERYLVDVIDLSDFGFDELIIGDPRTYGVELAVRF